MANVIIKVTINTNFAVRKTLLNKIIIKTIMKFFFSAFFIFLISLSALAQQKSIGNQWVICGARGAANSTWLLNQNQLNDKGVKYKPSWGGTGGIMLGFHYAEWGAVNVEALYSTHNQKLTSGIDSIKWNTNTKLSYLEFPILLHFDTQNFRYVEAGIKISSLLSATGSYDSSPSNLFNYSNRDIKNDFEKSNLALVFGWGGAIWGDGGLLIHGGFRLTYGLSDIRSTYGGKGSDYYPLSAEAGAKPKSYTKTNTASVGFIISADYDLGWFMSNSCNRKYKFFLFSH